MLRAKVGRLPVVDRDAPRSVLGYLGRAEILSAQTVETREPGWIERLLAPVLSFPVRLPIPEARVVNSKGIPMFGVDASRSEFEIGG